MPKLDIKICGLSTSETIDAAIAAGASHCGFVHFERSPRHLPLDAIGDLVRHVDGRAGTVVVTVDPDDALLDALARDVRPDAIQLHGRESPERVAEIAKRTGLGVVKALAVRSRDDIRAAARYRRVADRLLLDARRPAGSALPGGNGVAFDWRLLDDLDRDLPYFLAGGVSADNLAEAVATGPAGLDVSSGVESAPGVKDTALIAAFFAALRRAEGAAPHMHSHRETVPS